MDSETRLPLLWHRVPSRDTDLAVFFSLLPKGGVFLLTWEVRLLIMIKPSVSTSLLGPSLPPQLHQGHPGAADCRYEGPATSGTGQGTPVSQDSPPTSTPGTASHCASPLTPSPSFPPVSPRSNAHD